MQHTQMRGVLQRKVEQVRRLKELWARGSLGNLRSVLQMPQDHAVFCDLLRAVMRRRMQERLTLDGCQALLPIVGESELVGSKYDDFAVTALQFAEVLLEKFGALIADTRQSCAKIPERQLDLAREERLQKCNACYDQFREIHRFLQESRLASRFGSFRASLHIFIQRCN